MRLEFGQKIIDFIRQKKPKDTQAPVSESCTMNFKAGKHTRFAATPVIGHKDTEFGAFCSVAVNVMIGPGQHPKHFLSTHDFQYNPECKFDYEYNQKTFERYQPCKIGSDVWIGANVIVMDGINIGDGAIIGANSVICKDVPPYAIVVGGGGLLLATDLMSP